MEQPNPKPAEDNAVILQYLVNALSEKSDAKSQVLTNDKVGTMLRELIDELSRDEVVDDYKVDSAIAAKVAYQKILKDHTTLVKRGLSKDTREGVEPLLKVLEEKGKTIPDKKAHYQIKLKGGDVGQVLLKGCIDNLTSLEKKKVAAGYLRDVFVKKLIPVQEISLNDAGNAYQKTVEIKDTPLTEKNIALEANTNNEVAELLNTALVEKVKYFNRKLAQKRYNLPVITFCSKCGAVVDATDGFCGECGEKQT